MLFAVIPLEDNDRLPEFLEREADELYDDAAPHVYFLTYDGTASKLSEALQLGKKEGGGDGIVLRVTANAGYTYRALWDWLQERGG